MRVQRLDTSGVPNAAARAHLAENAVPLSALRERVGGDVGEIVDEFGDAHALLLGEWTSRDPDTLVTISFSFQQSNAPAGFRGTVYPSDVLALVRAASGDDQQTA
ncbi:MAG: hypothetical protein K0T00_2262 [Gaiellaceae bacterium]|nr:hypothetical protein [Gaiellaceae bacterium]